MRTNILKYFFTSQFLKFLLVGGVAAALNWASRIILSFWLNFQISVALAYGVGMFVAFILNATFVFPDSDKSTKLQARDFFIINIIFFPIVWIISIYVKYLLENLGMNSYVNELSHAIAIPCPMVVTFLSYKFIAFKENT